MSPTRFLNESITGTKSAPEVTIVEKVSLKMFTTTKPGSLVTVSRKNPAGIANTFSIMPLCVPPTDCKAFTNSTSTS